MRSKVTFLGFFHSYILFTFFSAVSAHAADRFIGFLPEKAPIKSKSDVLDSVRFQKLPEHFYASPTIFDSNKEPSKAPTSLVPFDIGLHTGVSEPAAAAQPFIIGGENVPVGGRGYQVSLYSSLLSGHACGGALIGEQWVLTAAHCVQSDVSREGLVAVVGANDLSAGDGLAIPVIDVVMHPEFSPVTLNNDVALLRLATSAPEDLPRLALANENFMALFAPVGTVATVSGWGLEDTTDTFTTPSVMQQVDAPVYDSQVCHDAYQAQVDNYPDVTEQMLCAGFAESTQGSCNGDSGGPLTVSFGGQDVSIGIVSWGGIGCSQPGLVGVYARTASFKSWIEEAMTMPYIPLQSINIGGGNIVSAAADTFTGFTFELPESAKDLKVSLSGGEGDADLMLFSNPYLIPSALECVSDNAGNTEECTMVLASKGTYSLIVSGFTDYSDVELSISYSEARTYGGDVVESITLRAYQYVDLYLNVAEVGSNFQARLTGGAGDVGILVGPLLAVPEGEDASFCFEYKSIDEPEVVCELKDLPVGEYFVRVFSFSDIKDVTLSVDYDSEKPFFPQAICQHNVVGQMGKYVMATINVVNVSDEFLTGWFVEWDYEVETNIAFMLNGLLMGQSPYKAGSLEPSSAISPNGVSTIYMLVESRDGVLNNPTVTGNFCF